MTNAEDIVVDDVITPGDTLTEVAPDQSPVTHPPQESSQDLAGDLQRMIDDANARISVGQAASGAGGHTAEAGAPPTPAPTATEPVRQADKAAGFFTPTTRVTPPPAPAPSPRTTEPSVARELVTERGPAAPATSSPAHERPAPVSAPPTPEPRVNDVPEAIKPLQVGLMDVAHSRRAEAEHLAGKEMIASKEALDRQRVAFGEKHPRLAQSVVGRSLLNIYQTAAHPVETIWKQNIFREFYRQKEIYSYLSGDKQAATAVGGSQAEHTLTRLQEAQTARQAGDTLAADTLQHTHETLQQQDTPEVAAFKADLTELMRTFATGDMTVADFEAAKQSLIIEKANWIEKRTGADKKESVDTIDSITRAAEQLKAVFEHTRSLDEIDQRLATLQLATGEARVGARTEAKATRVDGIIQKLSRNGLAAGLVNEQTIALATAAAAGLIGRGVGSAASRALKVGTFGAGSLVAGGMAYSRERMTMRQERAIVGRDMATNEQGADAPLELTPIREKLAESLGQFESAEGIEMAFHGLIERLPEGAEIDLPMDQAFEMLEMVTQVREAMRWGDAAGRDLIRYRSGETMDSERLAIDLQLARFMITLREHFNEDHPEQLPPGVDSFEQLLEIKSKLYSEQHLAPLIEAGDKQFEHLSQKRALTKAGMTIAGGVLGGLVIKEGLQFAGDRLHWGSTVVTPPHKMENSTHEIFGVSHTYPKDWSFSSEQGTMVDARTGKLLASGLGMDKTGGFNPESLAKLRGLGAKVDVQTFSVAGPPLETKVPAGDLANLIGTKIHRFHQDNNTTRFDLNELRTHVRVEQGNYVVDVRNMIPKGSYHNGHFVNGPAEFAQGKGHVLFSPDRNHQSTPFDLPLNNKGELIIPKNTEIAGDLFEPDGSLKAAFMEIGVPRGVNAQGVTQMDILSTVVGKNNLTEIAVKVPQQVELSHTVMSVMEGGGSRTTGYDAPWVFFPLPLSRFGLENIPQRQPDQSGVNVVGPADPGAVIRPPTVWPQPPRVIPGPRVVTPGPRVEAPGPPELGRGPQPFGVLGRGEQPFGELGRGTQLAGAIGPGSRPIGELGRGSQVEQTPIPLGRPERGRPTSERLVQLKADTDVTELTTSLLKVANMDVADYPRYAGISQRVERGIYTSGDLVELRALLRGAEYQIAGSTSVDRFENQKDIKAVRNYIDAMEQKFDNATLTKLDLIYESLDQYKKLAAVEQTLDLNLGDKQVTYGVYGNLVTRARAGVELSEEDYNWLAGMMDISGRYLEGLVPSAEGKDRVNALRQSHTAAAGRQAVRSKSRLRSRNRRRNAEVSSGRPSPDESPVVDVDAAVESVPEAATQPQTIRSPLDGGPSLEAPPASPESTPARRAPVQVGDRTMMGGREMIIQENDQGQLVAVPVSEVPNAESIAA